MAAPAFTVAFPGAIAKPIRRNFTARKRARTRGVLLHVDAGNAASLQGWFNNPAAGASSHLHVRKDGVIEQYVDMDQIAWTSGDGSGSTVGVETQGTGAGQWTPAQVASIVRIIRWCADRYGFPIRTMASSRITETGVGWHRLGVPASAAQKARGVSQTGGQLWSKSVGKTCPGPDRIRQIPGIVAQAAGPKGSTPNPAPIEEDDDMAYSEDELIQIAAEGVVRALGGKIAPDRLRAIVTEGAWAAEVGAEGSPNRRSMSAVLVSAQAAAAAAHAEAAALRTVLASVDAGEPVDYDRIDQAVRAAVAAGIQVDVTVSAPVVDSPAMED